MPMRIVIVGNGKMGQTVARLAPQHDCEVVRTIGSQQSAAGKSLTREELRGVTLQLSSPRHRRLRIIFAV